jgi:hypothetical protein
MEAITLDAREIHHAASVAGRCAMTKKEPPSTSSAAFLDLGLIQ